MTFLISMGNKPRAAPWKYKLPAILYAVLAVYLIACGALCTYKASLNPNGLNGQMLLSLLVTYGVYFLSSLLAFDPWHLATSAVPYFLLAPVYINLLNTYAFANLDDVSPGLSPLVACADSRTRFRGEPKRQETNISILELYKLRLTTRWSRLSWKRPLRTGIARTWTHCTV